MAGLAAWARCANNPAQSFTHLFNGTPRYGPVGFGTPLPVEQPTLVAPLVGSGSLLMQAFASSTREQICRADAAERGWIRGRLRTLAWVPGGLVGVNTWGLYCLADQLDLTGSTGQAFIVTHTTLSNQRQCELGPVTAGLSTTLGIPGTNAPLGLWDTDRLLALELEWDVTGGGVSLTYRSGAQADFSDLQDRATYLGAPLSAGAPVGEGLWMATSTGNSMKMFWDQTTIQPL